MFHIALIVSGLGGVKIRVGYDLVESLTLILTYQGPSTPWPQVPNISQAYKLIKDSGLLISYDLEF